MPDRFAPVRASVADYGAGAGAVDHAAGYPFIERLAALMPVTDPAAALYLCLIQHRFGIATFSQAFMAGNIGGWVLFGATPYRPVAQTLNRATSWTKAAMPGMRPPPPI